MTRGGRTQDISSPPARRIVYRRVAVLAAAIAVPAMAAPGLEQLEEPQVIRFVLPETIPYEASAPDRVTSRDAQTAALAPPAADFAPGPSAPAFAITGGLSTRLRAEHCLTLAIYYEAASEGEDGQRAVAQVVMNRVQHPGFPNSVCGVVFQGSGRQTGCQFSFTCDGSLARQPQQAIWNRAGQLAKAALGGLVFDKVGTATHYHTHAVNPYWASSLVSVGAIGEHRFYRWHGSAGQRQAFTARYDGFEQSPSQHFRASRTAAAVYRPAASNPARQAVPATPAETPAAASSAPRGDEQLLMPGSALEAYSSSGEWLIQP